MGTTIRDIAERCGVDISTVSRGLRGDPCVKPQTRERVLTAARELHYRPNIAARHLVSGRADTLWFVISSLGNPIEQWPTQVASRYLSEQGVDLLCALYHGDEAVLSRLAERMGQGAADGAFLIPHGGADAALFQRLMERGFPLVCVDRAVDGLRAPTVTNQNAESTVELVRRCHKEGCREFIILLQRRNSSERERHDAAVDEVARLKCECVLPFEMPQPFEPPAGNTPLALVASSQHAIAKFIAAHQTLGSHANLRYAAYDTWVGSSHPAQKAFIAVQDFDGIARRASDLMLRWIKEKRGPRGQFIRVPVKEYLTIS